MAHPEPATRQGVFLCRWNAEHVNAVVICEFLPYGEVVIGVVGARRATPERRSLHHRDQALFPPEIGEFS